MRGRSGVPSPVASTSPGNLAEMQILRPTESETTRNPHCSHCVEASISHLAFSPNLVLERLDELNPAPWIGNAGKARAGTWNFQFPLQHTLQNNRDYKGSPGGLWEWGQVGRLRRKDSG